MYCRIYNMCRGKMYDNDNTMEWKREVEIYRKGEEVQYLKTGCDKLKMVVVNPRTSTMKIS